MTATLQLAPPFACALSLVMLCCACGQVIHGYLHASHSGFGNRAGVIAYEVSWLAHMCIMCLFATAIASGLPVASVSLLGTFFPASGFLWANVIVAAIAAYTALSKFGGNDPDIDDYGWMPPLEALVACACLPPIVAFAGRAWIAVLGADAVYCAFRTAYLLACDRQRNARAMSVLAVAEAIKLLPEGVLYTDDRGRTQVANDTMRGCLAKIGLPVDFAHVDDLWALLGEKATDSQAAAIAPELFDGGGKQLIVPIGPDEVRLFSLSGPQPSGGADDGSPHGAHIIAFDITNEARALRAIDATNKALLASQNELLASLDTVRAAAESEAMLRMRSRVHDVIGQRLSMLHRALEDDAVSDSQLEKIKPLLTGILEDLKTEAEMDPAVEIGATVRAFGLAGVTIDITGTLPADRAKAKVYADCIREAATNAVKHAQAANIAVQMGGDALRVSNDGSLPNLPLRDGTGLAGMRRAAQSVGMRLSIDALERPFAVNLLPDR